MGNHESVDTTEATLAAWRERGADRLNPLRYHFIQALARRSASHSGAARRILDDRLRKLIQAFGEEVENAQAGLTNPGAVSAASPGQPASAPLAELLDYIAGRTPADDDSPAANGVAAWRASYPELAVLDYFKEIWSRTSSDRQLQQSLEQVHENAGPLNSSRLVHQSLLLMRELSPGYLHQFLSYADALSWMEQLNTGATLSGKDVPRAGSPKKSVRGKA
jgi:hypothetical protein